MYRVGTDDHLINKLQFANVEITELQSNVMFEKVAEKSLMSPLARAKHK